MLGKKLINSGPVSSGANTFASENFNTVLYTGTGAAQKIGGYINRAAVFNGSNSIITIPNNSVFNFTTPSSLSVWINRNTTNRDFIIDKANGGSGSYGWQLEYNGSEYVFQLNNTANGIMDLRATASGTLSWEHVVITYDSNQVGKIYLNGALQATATMSGTASFNTNGVTIGKYSLASGYEFDGKLDQLRFFNKALSSSEVTTLYGETFASTTKSTTDIFNDNSGVALYQFESNANDTGGVTGKYGEAAIFNGTSSKIRLPDNLINNVSPQTFSVAFWFKNDNLSAYGNPFSAYAWASGVNYGWSIYAGYGNGKIRFLSYSSNGNMDFSGATNLVQGTWYHCVLTYGGGYAKLYLNGSQDASTSISGNRTYISNHTYYIGAANNGAGGTEGYFTGRIEDVRIYTDVLTATEIGYIYNNTTASIPTDNLLAYYKLNGDARDEQQLYDGTATNVTYNFSGTPSNVTYQEATKFSPDLVWIKKRSSSTNADHMIFDSVRGADKVIISNSTQAEYDGGGTGYQSSFDSNGFSVTGNAFVNQASQTFVSWCFNAGTDAAATNNDGTISSTVKANTDAGFSIVKYTTSGVQSIGHGLSSAPELIIQKTLNVSGGSYWAVYSSATGTGKLLRLNEDSTVFTDSTFMSAVGNSTFTTSWSGTSYDYINYCFHSVDGMQKVGSYTGNNSTNGNFVETDFEPAFLLIKRADDVSSWTILDNKRSTGNPRNKALFAEVSDAESTYGGVDFLTNGFQITATQNNVNGGTYIYLAIAADPDTTTPTVENSFEVVTYSGDGNDRDINVGFKPDFVWIKERSDSAGYWHYLFNSIRGGNKPIFSNASNAESVNDNNGYLSSFNNDGFSITSGSLGMNSLNGSGKTYVAWAWKAGDHDDNLPEINDNGTIDSTVSVNDAAGFSIVKYTGNEQASQTIGHGLSSSPELAFIKQLDGGRDWIVPLFTETSGDYLELNDTAAKATDTNKWSAVSSTTFTVGADPYTNGTGSPYIGYFFTSITGYQKIGSYTGSTSGVSENIGFQPRYMLIKNVDSNYNWGVFDSSRPTSSGGRNYLYPDLAADEDSYSGSLSALTFTSTGFSIDNTNSAMINENLSTFIYLAIK